MTRGLPWRRPFPLGGAAFAGAGLVAVDRVHAVPIAVVAGVAGVGLATAAAGRIRAPSTAAVAVGVLGAAPFAWLIASRGGLVDVTWVRALVGAGIAIGGPLAGHTDHDWRRLALGPPLLVLSVAGIYATVPDTEEAIAILWVAAVVGVLGWPAIRVVRLGRGGGAASVAVALWVAGIDGRGRLTSVIGSVAALGLLAALPIGALLARGSRPRRMAPGLLAAIVVAAHAVLVLAASRVVGLETDVRDATVAAAGLGLLAVLAATALGGWHQRGSATG